MSGPRSTSGTTPFTVNNPVPVTPQDDQHSGVSPLSGQRYTPLINDDSDFGDGPQQTPIHSRMTRVNNSVVNQVNRGSVINKLRDAYEESYNEAESLQDQLDLAYSLREIRHYLENPALAKKCSKFSILWIPDEGKPVSVIPPGDELNDRKKASGLREQLHGQLDKLEKNYTVSQLQELEEKRDTAWDKVELAELRLGQMGELPPQMPVKQRIVFLDSFRLGQGSPSQPVLPPEPSTGQPIPQQTPPTMPGRTEPLTPHPVDETGTPPVPQTPGKPRFAIRFHEPTELQRPEEDEDDLESLLGDTNKFPAPPKRTPYLPPLGPQTVTKPEPVSFEGDDDLFDDDDDPDDPDPLLPNYWQPPQTPPPPPPIGKPATNTPGEEVDFDEESPLINLDDEEEEVVFDPLKDRPQTPPLTSSGFHPPRDIPSHFKRERPRPGVSVPFPPAPFGPQGTRITKPAPAPIPGPMPAIRLLGEGKKTTYSDIFRPGTMEDAFENNMASVNAGIPSLGVEDRIKFYNTNNERIGSAGKGSGINKRFARELGARGNIHGYEGFHKTMLDQCKQPAGLHYATPDELKGSPGLAASVALKADLDGLDENTGTVILDVFDGNYPNGNSTNRSMMYVVPPDGNNYEENEAEEFLADIEKTADRMVIVLQKYNEDAIAENERAGYERLPIIPTLRTCAFGAGKKHLHPEVSPEEVSQRIMAGFEKGIRRINQGGLKPLTITEIELEDGGYGAFSQAGVKNTIEEEPQFGEPLTPTTPTSPGSFFDFKGEYPGQLGVPGSREATPFMTPPTPQSDVLNAEAVGQIQTYPEMEMLLDPNRPATQLIEQLRACPKELGPSLHNRMGNIAKIELRTIHNQLGTVKPDFKRPDYPGKAHSIRKAMLTRALVNFHRKYADSDPANVREVKQIPEHAMPLIEFGVLCTRPRPAQILNGQGSKFDADNACMRMKKNGVPEGAAKAITNATAGFRPDGTTLTLLDKVVMDVERLEGMRTRDSFNLSELDCYKSVQSPQAREELEIICKEYRALLAEQRELQGGRKGSLRIDVGNQPKTKALAAYFDPNYRQYQENRDYLYAEQRKMFSNRPYLNALYSYQESLK